ncbi:hypothetical protein FJ434_01290 [Mesorhizobium sp. B2-5-13]|uniref:hypothetical protein n=1 Tax=unclassified Mesorhizobium TaxID=325217 RepID=UPI00112EAC2E|nr:MULTISPECIES: hypothetical protein [unclassified Mesorhizobium]TPJ43458.1 hypothetical protein FJ432_05900 [Mesorhizobium sp. B2-6-5]TPJ93361.1 hypothetical protein FJ434_01290 [Mesorhizobium sp. B2-5-13]TPK47554.1 hypothetical protein FJ560_16995 [Mesorhizobium sp. B2-5-5]
MSVQTLPSARLRNARANLLAMVEKAKSITTFTESPFESPVWVVSASKRNRASSANVNGDRLYFTDSKPGCRGIDGRVDLREPIASLIKAAVRLREDDNPRILNDHMELIRAGRFLQEAAKGINYDPALFLPDHFVAAAAASRKKDAESTAYNIGKKLVELADWTNRYNLAKVRIDFSNPNRRPNDHSMRVGPEAEARRIKKLPSDAALGALPILANMVTEDIDVLRMRTVELLGCGGWRINELLTIAADCEVEEAAFRQGKPVLDDQGKPVVRYGIRYFAEKIGSPRIKWIPTPLVSVARRAIADIRRITQPVRDDLMWMKQHPGRINVPGLSGNPGDLISLSRLACFLGLYPGTGRSWCRTWGVEIRELGQRESGVRSGDVADAIKRRWPDVPKLDEYMFLILQNATHAIRPSIPGSIRFLTDQMISHFLCGHAGVPSIFEQYGFTEPDGTPIRVTTHQFRHWLNTLAQEGGMSQMEIARWSGRKDDAENDFYDHVSGMHLAKKARELIEAGSIRGPLATASAGLPPKDRQQFLQTHLATAHVTDLGMCVHDWSLTPCLIHGDCSDCDDTIVVKGNEKQFRNAKALFDETTLLLAKAKSEVAAETYGAGRWEAAHERTLDGLARILGIHQDASIPDGTLVHLGKMATNTVPVRGREARA